MNVFVERIDKSAIKVLISQANQQNMFKDNQRVLDYCLMLTTSLWVGKVDDKLVCTWGLIPPTILSNQAYLWLYATDAVKDHEFLFVRHSQIAIQKMLEEYELITGHAEVTATKSIRWLRWLGAEFGESDGNILPFVIRKKHGA